VLYFIFHWISSVYETCGVSLFFIFSSTIFNNNIMKSKPKKSLRKIFRQFLCRLIVTCEAMFELSCNIATTMTGLNFKSRIQIKVVFLVGHLKWQIVLTDIRWIWQVQIFPAIFESFWQISSLSGYFNTDHFKF
jgi:hypothetical protein